MRDVGLHLYAQLQETPPPPHSQLNEAVDQSPMVGQPVPSHRTLRRQEVCTIRFPFLLANDAQPCRCITDITGTAFLELDLSVISTIIEQQQKKKIWLRITVNLPSGNGVVFVRGCKN